MDIGAISACAKGGPLESEATQVAEEPHGQGTRSSFLRYDLNKRKRNSKRTDETTAYVPVGRPSFLYVYLVSYSVLSKIRSSERVVVQLAMLITSVVPVNGWHMPEVAVGWSRVVTITFFGGLFFACRVLPCSCQVAPRASVG